MIKLKDLKQGKIEGELEGQNEKEECGSAKQLM